MIFNRPAVTATIIMVLVFIVGWLAATNERALEKCQETHSFDVCAHTLK